MKTHLLALVAALALFATGTAQAQYVDDDPFGERDDDVSAAPAQQPGMVDQAQQALFGTGNPGTVSPGLPQPDPQWSDLSTLTGERIEDTYEMKMREELAKPLPKRDPFGNRLDDVEGRFKPKKPY